MEQSLFKKYSKFQNFGETYCGMTRFKSVKGKLSILRQFLATERFLKMMKNAFYFTLKALPVLKILKCLSSIFGHVENGLIRKIRLILKFMTSKPR